MDTKNIPPHQYSRCRGLQPGSPQHLLLSFHTTAFRARAFATPPVPLRTSSQVTRQPLLSKQLEKNFCDFLRNRQQCRTSIVDLAFHSTANLPGICFLWKQRCRGNQQCCSHKGRNFYNSVDSTLEKSKKSSKMRIVRRDGGKTGKVIGVITSNIN